MSAAKPSYYEFDRRQWHNGMLIIRIHDSPTSEEQYDEFLQDMSAMYADKRKFSMMFDTKPLKKHLPLMFVRKLANWIREHREESKLYLEKTAIVVDGTFIKLFLEAVFKISPPSSPHCIANTAGECVKFLGWKPSTV